MSAALRTAPAVPTSAAHGIVRSRSYCPKASIRQSRQPSRTSASAEASRCAGVGGGGAAGAVALSGGRAHADAVSSRTKAEMPRTTRIESLDTGWGEIVLRPWFLVLGPF